MEQDLFRPPAPSARLLGTLAQRFSPADFLVPITLSEAKSLFGERPEPEPAASGSPRKGQEPNVGSGLA